jgi:putative transposase
MIRSYKSAVSKYAHQLGFDFAWQSRFHDHIIRNEQSFNTISEYILNNPLKWQEDKFYKDKIE